MEVADGKEIAVSRCRRRGGLSGKEARLSSPGSTHARTSSKRHSEKDTESIQQNVRKNS